MHPIIDIRTLLAQGVQLLKDTVSTPQLDAELLLSHLLNITRAQLYMHSNDKVEADVCHQFSQLIERRKLNEPIAYLLGYREFWSLKLTVTPATLIPRPETELLVELALSKFEQSQNICVADLGTGTGAIALAIAHERSHWSIIATDLLSETLKVAQLNAEQLNISNVTFHQGNWCDALENKKFHVIVSNPPYIAADDEHLQQDGLPFEPLKSLVGGKDGLSDLHTIITQSLKHLLPGGWLLVEHGFDQAETVSQFFLACGYYNVTTHHDLAGCARVTAGQIYKK